jgi:ferrous iron transport protein B
LLHVNKIVIVGNPNVGKSVLFNQITKSYSLVANVPYTTVSVYRANINIEGNRYEIIDTPGILSLDVQSEDGLVTRNILMEEHPEVIILCFDTNNIKRSLLLTAQINELEIPMVICLNFLDESRQKGIVIARKKLEEMLGVPVIETVASEGRGIKELKKAVSQAAVPLKARVSYKQFIEEGLDDISGCFPPDSVLHDSILMLLLMKDPWIEKFIKIKHGEQILEKVKGTVERVHRHTAKDISRIVFEERNRWAENITQAVTEKHPEEGWESGQIIARLSRHPVFGWFVLAGVVYVTYLLVGEVAANFIAPFIDQKIFLPINTVIGDIVPWQLLKDFLIGEYGILTTGLENALGTVLPILTMFFLILNFLEDIGYIPNLCVLCNRLFQKVGLSGKAILPVVLGFGCKTMATLATKILDSKKERYIAIFLIAFAIPCSSQLGINLAILALFPFKAFLIVFGVLIAVELIAGVSLNIIMKEDRGYTDFIMEIPPIRHPDFKSLMTKTYYRLKWFLVEAIPLFVIGAFILFLMDKFYILALIKTFIFPVIVSFLNLPIKTVDAFLLCLARHEAGAVILMDMVTAGELDYIQTLVSVIIVTCFVPCFANVMAMIKELGLKSALWMVLVIIVFSVIIGAIVNYTLRSF